MTQLCPNCNAVLEVKSFHGLEIIFCHVCDYIKTNPARDRGLARPGRDEGGERLAVAAADLAAERAAAHSGSGHFRGNVGKD